MYVCIYIYTYVCVCVSQYVILHIECLLLTLQSFSMSFTSCWLRNISSDSEYLHVT